MIHFAWEEKLFLLADEVRAVPEVGGASSEREGRALSYRGGPSSDWSVGRGLLDKRRRGYSFLTFEFGM